MFVTHVGATTPALTQALPTQSFPAGGGGSVTIDLRQHFGLPGVTGQIVQFDTDFGRFNVELHPQAAPLTVANFLNYVNRGDYNYTFIHRSETNFVIQGGGFYFYQGSPYYLPTDPPIPLEYNLPNVRGTIAMARTNDVNSATSQWFFNLVDNTTTLGPANGGGYAVFGRVLGTGMSVVDAIAALGVYNILGPEYGNQHPLMRVPLRVVNGQYFLVEQAITTIPLYSAGTGSAVLSFSVQNSNPDVATATIAGSELSVTAPGSSGSATIVVTATDTNGNTASGSFTVSVNKLAQSITFASLADRPFSTAPIALSAQASSGLQVSFMIVEGPAEMSGSTLTVLAPGKITVRAEQGGDGSYAAASAVERTFTVAPNFAFWQIENFSAEERANPALSGPHAEFAGDGLSNLVKYALGLDPRLAVTGGLPQASLVSGEWNFTYARPPDRADIVYAVEMSTNLTTWTTTGVTHEFVTVTDDIEHWRARVSAAAGAAVFFRLKVTQP